MTEASSILKNGISLRNGMLYSNRKGFDNLDSSEIISSPTYPIFAMRGAEKLVFEKSKATDSWLYYGLTKNIITEVDKLILALVCTFSKVGITSKNIAELICLLDVDIKSLHLRRASDSSINRLFRYGLIDFVRFHSEDLIKPSSVRCIIPTPAGYKLAKSLGVELPHYSPIEIATRDVYVWKRGLATAQIVLQWLKHITSVSFSFKQTIKDFFDKDNRAIVSPSASIVVNSNEETETIYFECIRRNEAYKTDFGDKLERYCLVFSYMGIKPSLVVVCEDEEHSRAIYDYLVDEGLSYDGLVFTHDLLVASDNFFNAFYTYDGDKRIQLKL